MRKRSSLLHRGGAALLSGSALAAACLACLALPAQAALVYTWAGTCQARLLTTVQGDVDLGCSSPVRGEFRMPASYVPGTLYAETPGDDRAWLTILDDFFLLPDGRRQFHAPMSRPSFTLPVEAGPPEGYFNNNSGYAMSILNGRLFFGIDLFGGVNRGYRIVATDVTAQRVPTPGTLALAALGLAALAGWRARTGHRQ